MNCLVASSRFIKPYRTKQTLKLSPSILSTQKCLGADRKLSSKPYFIDSAPVKWTQETLITIHDFTGLPWWGSIICSVVGLRLLTTFPLALYQSYVLARFQNLKPEIDNLAEEIKKEMPLAIRKYNLNEKAAKKLFKSSLKKQINQLIVRDNCHPVKGIISVYIQLPVWICVSLSLRNLSLLYDPESVNVQKAYLQLVAEGILWFPDLTMVDSSFALPLMLGLVNLTTIEIHALQTIATTTKLKTWTKNIMRGISILLIPIAATMPSSVVLYWLTSSSFGLVQNLVIQLPKVKRFFGIPMTTVEISAPMKHLNVEIRKKMSKLFKKKDL